ncbi:putative reverse transcriptase domain-containing protein [Tanacetum coccineum]
MEKGFLSPKGRGRWNGVKEKIKNVADIPVANKEYNDDFVKGNSVTGPSCIDMNVDQNSLNSGTDTLGDTFGTPNEERADIVGKESEGLNSSPTGIASSPFVSFATLAKDEMKSMSENGPWLIRNVSLILKKWTPNANIMKENVCNILVSVKFHDIPITIFTEDGLSVIATKLGNPLMLDSYTTAMCTNSWGKASNARPMVEVRADFELKDTIVVLVPKFFGDGYIVSTIYVEYEWATPRCSSCHVFGHGIDECPKKIVSDVFLVMKCVLVDDDGKPLENVDYSSNQGSEDEVDSVDNEMTSYLASKSPGVEYATKSLLEQWRKTYVDDDYDPYDDDMYECQKISDNIQSICNNLDIKVRGR